MYSLCDISEENVNSCNIIINKNLEKNKNINLDDNIKNNFYSKYQKIIYEFIKFQENTDKEEIFIEKNYMKMMKFFTFLKMLKQ